MFSAHANCETDFGGQSPSGIPFSRRTLFVSSNFSPESSAALVVPSVLPKAKALHSCGRKRGANLIALVSGKTVLKPLLARFCLFLSDSCLTRAAPSVLRPHLRTMDGTRIPRLLLQPQEILTTSEKCVSSKQCRVIHHTHGTAANTLGTLSIKSGTPPHYTWTRGHYTELCPQYRWHRNARNPLSALGFFQPLRYSTVSTVLKLLPRRSLEF